MKAVIWTKYGKAEYLKLEEVEKPIPKDNEVLIKIYATTVTTGDCEMRALKFPFMFKLLLRMYFGFIKPKSVILGQEFAGEIEEIGENVTNFKIGDKIFGTSGMKLGGYGQYLSLPATNSMGAIDIMPSNMTFEEAAGIPVGGFEAIHFLRKGNIKQGEKLLINGAGGSIGTLALQLAKHYGANVTCVDKSSKLSMLKSLGADNVIDYEKVDFTRASERYDLILDIVGTTKFFSSLKLLRRNGRYLIANPNFTHKLLKYFIINKTGKKVIHDSASHKVEVLKYIKTLIESNVLKIVIDKTYPLEDIILAHKYVESGNKAGSLIITINHER